MATLTTLGTVAALALLVLVPGVPAAFLVDRRRPAPIAPILALAIILGLAIEVLVVVLLVHSGVFGRITLLTATALISVAMWAFAARARPSLAAPRFTVAGVAMCATFAGAIAIRTDPIYFIYQTADFGEYVNRANQLVAGRGFGEFFLNLFPAALAIPAALFGPQFAVHLMPLLGIALMAGLAAIVHRLGYHPWLSVAVAFTSAFHIMPVWFSEFPASEMLSAVLLVGMLLVAVVAIDTRSAPAAYAAGSFGFLLATVRINAVLAIPMVILALIASSLVLDESDARSVERITWAFFVSSALGFFYDITFNSAYFVEAQLGLYLPGRAVDAAAAMSNPLLMGLVTIAAGIVIWSMIRVSRWVALRPSLAMALSRSVPILLLAATLGFVAVRAVGGDVAMPAGRLESLGPVLIVLAVAGIVIGAFAAGAGGAGRHVVYWIATLVTIAFTILQAVRVDQPGNEVAPYFLYWDRYYLSEVFPLALLLAVFALSYVASRLERVTSSARAGAAIPIAVAAALMVAIGIAALPPNVAVARGSMFSDAYESIEALDGLTGNPPDAPIIYVGTSTLPESWFWTNTTRIVALPLIESFGRTVIGVPGPRDPDPAVGEGEMLSYLEGIDEDTVYLVIAGAEPIRDLDLEAHGWTSREAGTTRLAITRLPWDRHRQAGDQEYVSTFLDLTVIRLDRVAT